MSTRWAVVAMAGAAAVLTATAVRSSPPAVGAGATTTAAPTTTGAAATTVTPSTTTPPSLPPPADEDSDPVRSLLPSIVAVDDVLTSPAERQPLVAAALTEDSNSVAVEETPGTLCAAVPVTAPLMASGRWERDGEPVASAALARRDPPGFGDCITADDVGDFENGVYQYVAVGESGATSAAATLVIGAPAVAVWLLNDGDMPVCLVQTSPREGDFYEAFQPDSELLPGEALALRVAAVEQDVRVYGCPPDEVVRSLDVVPEAGVYVELFGGEEPGDPTPSSAPGGSATSTTVPPPTTG
jgi:hypothetical protein